jgi:hypothetical protein
MEHLKTNLDTVKSYEWTLVENNPSKDETSVSICNDSQLPEITGES